MLGFAGQILEGREWAELGVFRPHESLGCFWKLPSWSCLWTFVLAVPSSCNTLPLYRPLLKYGLPSRAPTSPELFLSPCTIITWDLVCVHRHVPQTPSPRVTTVSLALGTS